MPGDLKSEPGSVGQVAKRRQPVILGDLNDYDGDADSRDQRDNMPVTNVLRSSRGWTRPTLMTT